MTGQRLEFIDPVCRHKLLSRLDVVSLEVLAEVVATHESLAAVVAGESFFARVSLQMALQFVRPRERLPAEEPRAGEGSLAGVPAQVSLQMRRLPVDLGTAGNVADVLSLSADRRRPLRRIQAVGTATPSAAPRRRRK